jgi:hypothetical protein
VIRRAHGIAWADRAWRRATAPARDLPDFVIIGAQRSGTTSLYDWLSAHAVVAPATRKELHYFDMHYERGLGWYRAHFPMGRPGRVTGEATPYLLFHPLAPERVARDLPETTRFVVLLRDPVQRAVSHYWHERRLQTETESLPVALELEEERLAGAEEQVSRGEANFAHLHHSYKARGRYAEQLRRWFAHIDRTRLLVVESELLFADPAVPGRIAAWLGLSPGTAVFPAHNEAKRHEDTDPEVLRCLTDYFAPYNDELFELLGQPLWEEAAESA